MDNLMSGLFISFLMASILKQSIGEIKVVKAITNVIFAIYGLSLIITVIVVWVKNDWGTGLFAGFLMYLPWALHNFFANQNGGWTRREWKDGAPHTLDKE